MHNWIVQLGKYTAILYLLWSICLPIWAQTSGTLDGSVVDENRQAVSAALVTVVNENNGVPHTARTNAEGRYVIPFLEPGRYTIKVARDGYQDSTVGNFVIPLNKVTVTLPPIEIRSLASIAAQTAVNASPPTTTPAANNAPSNKTIIDLTDATNRGNYDLDLLTALPLGGVRTFDFFALLTPGVLPAPATTGQSGPGLGPGVGSSGQFAVNGRRARSNNFTIDGSDNNDQDIGVRRQGFVSLVPQSIESVNEFQISTQTWDAELGRNSGAQVNAVSRSGGNDIHATAYGFFNNDRLNARNFFDLQGGPSGKEDNTTRTQAGFVLGGPIVRDRTHYFLSYEHQQFNTQQEHHFAVPTLSQRFFNNDRQNILTTSVGQALLSSVPLPNNLGGPYASNTFTQILPSGAQGDVFSVKLTERRGSSVFTGRYNFTDDESLIPSVGGAINGSIGTSTRTQNVSLFLDTTFSATTFNQIRFSYGRTTLDFPAQPGSPLLFGESAASLNVTRLRSEIPDIVQSFVPEVFLSPITTSFGQFGPFGRTGPIGQLVLSPFSPVGVDPFTFPQARASNTFQIADTLVKTLGNHAVKLGGDIRRNQLNSQLDRNFRPQVVFNSGLVDLTGSLQNGIRMIDLNRGNLLLGSDLATAGVASQIFQTLAVVPDSRIGLRFTELNFFAQDNWRVTPRLTIDYGLRYEYTTVPREVNNKIEQTFDLQLPASNPLIAQSVNGPTFQPLFEGFFNDAQAALQQFLAGREGIYRPDRNNFSPRIGLAYDLTGRSRTVLRLGYGIYYDQIIGSVTSQSRNVFPNFIPVVLDPRFSFDDNGRVIVPVGTIRDQQLGDVGLNFPFIQPGTLNTLGFGPDLFRYGLGQLLLATGARNPISNGGSRGGGLAFILPDANFRTPYSQQWNVQLQQQFGQNFTASIGYVGSTGTKLIRFRTPNMGPNTLGLLRRNAGAQIGFEPTSMASNRPIPELGPFTVIESAASSNYHSLQLSINKRFSDGLQFSSAYTYGQIIDEVSDVFDTAGTFNLPQDNHNLRAERAAAAFDIRHRSITYFNYQLPFFKDNRWFGDYQLAGVLTLQTGQPFTVNVALDANIDGNLTDRPSVAIFQQVDRGINRLVTDITDPESQIAAAIGRNLGNSGFLGRNTQRAPGLASMDLAVIKKFALTDRQTLLIRTEIFNLFNRTHFAVPVRTIGAPAFGRAVSTALPARIIQFAVKYQF